MLIGIFFAGIISYAFPESLIQDYLGGVFGSMQWQLWGLQKTSPQRSEVGLCGFPSSLNVIWNFPKLKKCGSSKYN
jgi:hypothetical protein